MPPRAYLWMDEEEYQLRHRLMEEIKARVLAQVIVPDDPPVVTFTPSVRSLLLDRRPRGEKESVREHRRRRLLASRSRQDAPPSTPPISLAYYDRARESVVQSTRTMRR